MLSARLCEMQEDSNMEQGAEGGQYREGSNILQGSQGGQDAEDINMKAEAEGFQAAGDKNMQQHMEGGQDANRVDGAASRQYALVIRGHSLDLEASNVLTRITAATRFVQDNTGRRVPSRSFVSGEFSWDDKVVTPHINNAAGRDEPATTIEASVQQISTFKRQLAGIRRRHGLGRRPRRRKLTDHKRDNTKDHGDIRKEIAALRAEFTNHLAKYRSFTASTKTAFEAHDTDLDNIEETAKDALRRTGKMSDKALAKLDTLSAETFAKLDKPGDDALTYGQMSSVAGINTSCVRRNISISKTNVTSEEFATGATSVVLVKNPKSGLPRMSRGYATARCCDGQHLAVNRYPHQVGKSIGEHLLDAYFLVIIQLGTTYRFVPGYVRAAVDVFHGGNDIREAPVTQLCYTSKGEGCGTGMNMQPTLLKICVKPSFLLSLHVRLRRTDLAKIRSICLLLPHCGYGYTSEVPRAPQRNETNFLARYVALLFGLIEGEEVPPRLERLKRWRGGDNFKANADTFRSGGDTEADIRARMSIVISVAKRVIGEMAEVVVSTIYSATEPHVRAFIKTAHALLVNEEAAMTTANILMVYGPFEPGPLRDGQPFLLDGGNRYSKNLIMVGDYL
ncbi:hypothetical protein GE09DRAFT_1183172 [Coniochaeta sp. 2T2.1]|nr:hypothetical protein GE09DRAFT_1183172 [Coniochaeta sp. 2T2.1]